MRDDDDGPRKPGRLTRRSFLLSSALAGGAAILPTGSLLLSSGCPGSASARKTPHYFVFYFMMGGWDVMLNTEGFLASKSDLWVPYDDGEVVEAGGHRFGPTMKPLKAYFKKMAVLRGIYCDTLNHPQARVRMCTGRFKPPGGPRPGVPSVQAILGEKLGQGYEIPNLSGDGLRPSTFRGDGQDPHLEPVRVASVDQLKGLVNWKGDVGKYKADIQRALAQKDAMTTAQYDKAALADEFDDYAAIASEALVGDFPQRVHGMSNQITDVDKTTKAARMAVEAIKNDVSPVITIGSGEFDSHTKAQYAGHPAAVMRGMRAVATVCDGLEAEKMPGGKTLLDYTTVVVTSEFSRAPSKNELGGKHHWPANSFLLIGKGVRHPKREGPFVFGETDEGMSPVAINASNGSHGRGADLLEMSHGLATVLAIGGVDPVAAIRQEPIPDLMAG